MISAKLKLCGVEPCVVGALHEAVMTSKFEVPEGYKSDMNPAHVSIADCRLDKEYGTYTVSLDLHLHINCRDADAYGVTHQPKYFLYQTAGALVRLLRSVDPNLLPDEEMPIPADEETRQILAKRKQEAEFKRVSSEVSALTSKLKGKSFGFTIQDAQERTVVGAGTVLDGDVLFNLNNRILYHGLKLDTITDENVRSILQRAEEVAKDVAKSS